MTANTPLVKIKRKNITALFDYCLDNKIQLTVKPLPSTEEFEIEFNLTDYSRAILLGMFLREQKIELANLAPVISTPIAKLSKKEVKEIQAVSSNETFAALAFDENPAELKF